MGSSRPNCFRWHNRLAVHLARAAGWLTEVDHELIDAYFAGAADQSSQHGLPTLTGSNNTAREMVAIARTVSTRRQVAAAMGRRRNRPPVGQQTGNTVAAGAYSSLPLAVFGAVGLAMSVVTLFYTWAQRTNQVLRVDVNELQTRLGTLQETNKVLNADVDNMRKNVSGMQQSVNAVIREAKGSLQREIVDKLGKAKTDMNSVTDSAIARLQKEINRIQDQSANGLTVLRELSAPSTASPPQDARSAENARYRITIYFNKQTERSFEDCRRRLQAVGFPVNGLDRTRALAIAEQLKSSEGAPKWSLNQVGANMITATEDALPKAKQVSRFLEEAGLDIGKEVLDWGEFRRRYGDSMLTKAFPNATGLIEIYLLVSAGSAPP